MYGTYFIADLVVHILNYPKIVPELQNLDHSFIFIKYVFLCIHA